MAHNLGRRNSFFLFLFSFGDEAHNKIFHGQLEEMDALMADKSQFFFFPFFFSVLVTRATSFTYRAEKRTCLISRRINQLYLPLESH